MQFIKNFKEISKLDVSIAGGKGASLGEMTQAEIPVPYGFVVLSNAFERFIEETDLNVEIDSILHKVKHDDINTVENASEQIKALILSAEMSEDIADEIVKSFKRLGAKYVAVRSSATSEDSASAAWAGQLESYLNTTEKNLLENVKKCWASLFTPRAIFYRFEKNLHTSKISVAVVIQKMIESDVSGIAFSVHPVTQDKNQLIIESAYGLGEAIVSGQITPDGYVVEKEPRRIIDENIANQERGLYRIEKGGNEWKDIKHGNKQKLTDKEILELTELILKIEKHYGFPVDVEWAYEKGKFYIVQSRPITTLTDNEKIESKDKLIFEKTITRDWPLFIVEMLHQGFTDEFKRQFGFGYSDVLFDCYSDHLDIYRAPKEHVEKIRSFVLEQLEKNKKFVTNCSHKLLKFYENFIKKIDEIDKSKLFSLPNKKLATIIKEFIQVHKELEPTFVINFWFPIQMENHPLKEKWKDEIEVAAKTRAITEKVGPEGDRIARKLADEVSRRIFGEKEFSKFILLDEAYNFLLKGKSINKNEIKKRTKGFVFASKGIKYVPLKDYVKELGYEIKTAEIKEDKDIIKGTTAYKGIVKGKVKVILSKQKINTINEGDILVTAMTTPEFVPAIKKAAAIITDEGGITCHAAIVSRELKKPCIIGTKIATQILKDGMEVEVDADKGIVKIIGGNESKLYIKRNELDFVLSKDWIFLVGRPYTLFGASLYQRWFDPTQILALFNESILDNLYIEEHPSVVRRYVIKDQLEAFKKVIERIVKKDKKKCEEILKRGLYLSDKAKEYLKKSPFSDLKSAVDFLVELTLHATVFSYFSYPKLSEMKDDKFLPIAEKLRAISYYPDIVQKIINPLAKKEAGEDYNFLTVSEILSKNTAPAKTRKKESKTMRFIYAKINGKEYVYYVDNVFELIKKLDHIQVSDCVRGQTAYPGKVVGTAKLILSSTDLDVDFNDGDILVAVTTNPTLMPLIRKSSAIVSDEGGVTCHAAIVSRELKKPCVIGTKYATHIFQNDDIIEVDADKGIVRILKRNEKQLPQEKTLVKQFKENIGSEELLVVRGKFIPLFLLTDWLKFYDEDFKEKEGIYPVLSIKRNDIFTHYISLDKYLQTSEKAIKRYIRNTGYKEEIDNRYERIKNEINSLYQIYFDKKEQTEKELLETLKKSEEYLHELVALTLFIDFLDEEIVKKAYESEGFKLNFEKIFNVTKIYDFQSFDLKNNIEIVNKKNGNVEYLKQVYTGYSAAPTKEEVESKVSKINIEELKKEIENSKKEILRKSVEKKNLRDKLNNEEKSVADFLSWIIKMRDDRKPLMNKLDVLFNECVVELYKIWGIETNLSFVSYIFEVLKGKEYITKNIEIVKRRQGEFVNLYYGDNRYSEKYDNLKEEFEEAKSLEKPSSDIKSVKGQIANKGKARGIARIIYDPKKFHSFTEGDILVTSMTRPEFVPIMRKASAIVTNEGGIACHAAIVSRELNKPCVIGTKNATEIIRDGDEVEVDADKGIIRILGLKESVFDKFMKGFEKDVFYPLVPVSILAAGAGGFTPNFGGKVKDLNIRFLIAMKEGKAFVLMSETRYNMISENFFVKYIKDKKVLAKTISYLNDLEKEINRIYSDLSYENIDLYEEKEVIKKLDRIMSLVREYNCTAWFSTQFDRELVFEFINKYNLKLKPGNVEKVWNKAIVPTEDSFDKRRHKKILNLLSSSKNIKEMAEEMQYAYSGYTEIKSIKDVEDSIKKEYSKYFKDNKKIVGELKKEKLEYKEIKDAFNKWKKYLNKEEKELVDYIQTIIFLRDKRKDVMGKGIVVNFRVGEKFFKEIGLSKELIYYCAYEEFLNGKCYFQDKKEEILNRPKGVLFLHSYDGSIKFEYEKFDDIKKKMEGTYLKSQKRDKESIIGQVAYKGDIKGKVKIVLRPSEFNKFKRGDILVTSMTRPEFVPLMKIASAIITDEGGITCHAAIVSRELKIPCVIGTKIATQVLKDGDIIEVDANKGVVRIVNQEQSEQDSEYMFLEHVPGGYPLDVTYINLFHVTAPSLRKEFGIDSAGTIVLIFENGGYTIYVEKDKWFNAGERILRYTLENDQRVEAWESRFKKWGRELDKLNKKYSKIKFNKFSNSDLYKEFEKILNIERKNGLEDAEVVTNNYGTNLIYKELEKTLNELGFEANKTAQILLRSTGKFPILEYEEKIGGLALSLLKKKISSIDLEKLNKDLRKEIDLIIEEYGWLDASLVYHPKSVESVVADVNDLLSFGNELPRILEERIKEKISQIYIRKCRTWKNLG